MTETYIINNILKSKKKTSKVIKDTMIYFYDNIGEEGCFDKYITYKFNEKDLFTREMKVNIFLLQMILWEPFAGKNIKLDKSSITKGLKGMDNDTLRVYYNKLIDMFVGKMDIKLQNRMIAKVQERMKKISEDFSMILGLSFSIRNLCDLCDNHKDIDKLLHYTPPKLAQTKEIENDYNYHGKELINLMKKYESPYKYLLGANEGVKPKQFQQYMLCVGFQSNMDGITYPKPIEGSYMNKGLQSASEYFLDATMGRKAQIYQKKYTGDSGYFSRRLTYTALDIVINHEIDDCHVDVNNLTPVKIKSPAYVKTLNGLFYKTDRHAIFYKVFNFRDKKETEALVGKTVYVRSPLTCACKEGICKKCYGKLSNINYDINVGIFGSETVAARLMQSILSSKHLLNTESSIIELSPGYKKYFTIDTNAIIFDPEDHHKHKGKNKLYIVYSDMDTKILDENDELDEKEFYKSINKFRIIKGDGEVMATIEDKNGTDFYVPYEIEKEAKTVVDDETDNVEYWIPMSNLEYGDIVFYIEIVSKELKKPLNEITALLDNKGHLGYDTIQSMTNRLIELFIESKLGFTSVMVHMLTSIRGMIRRVDNINKLPDFSKQVYDDEYDILTIKDSIYNNGSIILALSFERLGQLLRKPDMYYRVSKRSIIDPLFYKRFVRLSGNEVII